MMTGISGIRGSRGTNQPLLDEGGRPFEQGIWELAVARITQGYMASEEGTPPDLQNIKVIASQTLDHSVATRMNRLIERLWSETASHPSSSTQLPVESVYYHAVSRFAERFEIPFMQGASFSLQQGWLLARATDLGVASDPLRKIGDEELRQDVGERLASKLRALSRDPSCSAESWRQLLQMVLDLVRTKFVSEGKLQALLDQPDLKRALQELAPVHSAQLLSRMDGEIERALHGEQMAQMPGGVTAEQIKNFQKHWRMLRDQVLHNLSFKTFNKALTSDQRAVLYNLYMTRLGEAWEHFKDQEPWRMLEAIPEFLEACEAGWDQQISQLIEQMSGRASVVLQPLVHARAERLGELEKQLAASGLGTSVHYERALRQQLNNRLALGFSLEQLWGAESEEVQRVVQQTAQAIVEAVDPRDPGERARRSRESMQRSWNSLSKAEQEQLQQAICELWQDALQRGAEPYFLATEDLKRIRQYQEDVRRAFKGQANGVHAGQSLVRLLRSPPLSVTGLPLLNGELEPLCAAVQASDWERFYTLVNNLAIQSELRAFHNAVSGSCRAEILQALWAGALGIGSFEELKFKRLCGDLVPEDVRQARDAWVRAIEAAQVKGWQSLFSREGHGAVPNEAWQNRGFVLAVVHQDAWALQYAAHALKADREFVLEAVRLNGHALRYASTFLKTDREIVLTAIRDAPWWLRDGPKEFRADREFTLDAMRRNGGALQYAADGLRADWGIVLAAIQQNGHVLRYAAEELKVDGGFMLAAVRTVGATILLEASEVLRSDREFMLAAVQQDGWALQYAAEELRADREVVLAAIQGNGFALLFAAEELRADREIVLAALHANALALDYAAADLRADREVVLVALHANALALAFAAADLRADRWIVLAAIQRDARALRYASEELRSDRAFMLEAVKETAEAARWAAETLQQDRSFNLEAARTNGLTLPWLRNGGDRAIAVAAAKQNVEAIGLASTALLEDPLFIMELALLNPEADRFVRERLGLDPGLMADLLWNQGVVGKFQLTLFRAKRFLHYWRR